MSEAGPVAQDARGDRGLLCPQCEHLNPLGRETCERCEAHLFVECARCGHVNQRVFVRCQKCHKRLHRGLFHRSRRHHHRHEHHRHSRGRRIGLLLFQAGLVALGLGLAFAVVHLINRIL